MSLKKKKTTDTSKRSISEGNAVNQNDNGSEIDTIVEVKKSRQGKGEIKSVEEALKLIKKTLQAIPTMPELSFQDAQNWCKSRGVSMPYPTGQAPSDSFCSSPAAKELTFAFEAPKNVAIVGSFMLQTSLTTSDSNVDLVIEQPEGLIFRYTNGAKDHINWKYLLRKSFYLAVCYASIKEVLPESAKISFDFINPFKPLICIKIFGIERIIRVIPSLPFSEAFKSKLFRLSPQRSNIRPAWLNGWKGADDLTREEPTPYHNYSILSDALYLPHLIYLHETLQGSSTLISAIKMLKAWLKQAQINPITSINGFLASMWVVDMVRQGIINPSIMDEMQIFKVVLKSWIDAFGGKEFTTFSKKLQGFPEENEDFDHGALAFIAGSMNLFYSANVNSLQCLAQLASSTLLFLQSHPDRLDKIFLSDLALDSFSQDLAFEVSRVTPENIKGLPVSVPLNYGNIFISGYLEGRIALVLRKGLTDRIRGPLTIRISKETTTKDDCYKITIAAALDPLYASRVIDLGPTSDDAEAAAKFRGFWGKKSELRQFKDAAIRECVSWESVEDRESIPSEIISYLLTRHFNMSGCNFVNTSKNITFAQSTSEFGSFSAFSGAFDALSRELRGLAIVLPLTIVQCTGLSSAHRHTSLVMPQPLKSLSQEFPSSILPSPSQPVYDFLIQFERSSAWPDERQALQAARQAFLLQLNRTIRNRGIAEQSLVSSEYIDIYYMGYIFRGWIEVPREALRCRAEGLVKEAERIERRCFWQSKLTTVLHRLALRNVAFPPTVRLIKKFMAGHFLLPLIDEDLLDCLVAQIFVETDQRGSGNAMWSGSLLQNKPIGSAYCGFLRFLDLIANFPWTERSLVLDFSFLDSEEQAFAYTHLEEEAMKGVDWSVLMRIKEESAVSILPIFTKEQHVMIVKSLEIIASSSSEDTMNLIPTLPHESLDRLTLIRLKLIAKLTLEHLQSDSGSKFESLAGFFCESADAIREDYDILIKLDPEQLQLKSVHHIEGLSRIMRNAPQATALLFSALPGFNAAERLFKDLRSNIQPLSAVISYNPTNPIIMMVRVKKHEMMDQVTKVIERIGGDLIMSLKKTATLQ